MILSTYIPCDTPAILLEASPPRYNFLYSTRKEVKGGGTATIFLASLDFKDWSFKEFNDYKSFIFGSPPILCIMNYRPPKWCMTELSFEVIFNVHVDNESDFFATKFVGLLDCMDFLQHVTQPTHNRGQKLVLAITHSLSANISSVVDIGLYDHWHVFFLL